jgi:hypothetical protein
MPAAMAQLSARERLTRLVDLASEAGVSARRELTGELADLLLDWPANYPATMREPFEALLEKALRDVEPPARTLMAERFVKHSRMPLTVLNQLIFDAPPEIQIKILSRNADAHAHNVAPPHIDGALLLFAARRATPDGLAETLATRFGIKPEIAASVLRDHSAQSLAILCKGAKLTRAAFSALAVLARPDVAGDEHYRRLAVYDSVPDDGARALLVFWRSQLDPIPPAVEAA